MLSGERFTPRFRPCVRAAAFVLTLTLLAAGCSCGPAPQASPTAVGQDVPPSVLPPTSAPVTLVPTATMVITGPSLVRMEPSILSDFVVGEARQVQILLDNVDGVHEIELHISFEPRYVSIADADPGTDGVQIQPGNMPAPTRVIENDVQNSAGLFVYHVAQEEGTSARGSGVVAIFTVQALAEGGSPLRFNTVTLKDAAGQPLPDPQWSSGMAVIDAVGTPSVSATEPASSAATAMPTAPVEMPTVPPAGLTHYTVQAGDTLYSIARRYGTTVEAIVSANGLPDASSIRVGQVLLIPAGGGTTGGRTYVVQPGDTLYSIAKRYGTTVDRLAALNGLTSPYTIKVGQTLVIP